MKAAELRRGICLLLLTLSLTGISSPQPSSFDWTWLNPLPQGNGLFGVHMLDANTIFVAGDFGIIHRSADAGQTWTQIPLDVFGSNTYLYHISFIDASNGFILGSNGIIQRTTNGGSTWSAATSNTSSWLYDLDFVDGSTGFISGDGGTVLKTTDGGQNWSPLTTSVTEILRAIHFSDPLNGTAVGTNGRIIRTTDGGVSWNPQTSGIITQLWGIHMFDANTGVAAGWSSILLYTTDGGTSWNPGTNTWFDSFNDLLSINDSTIITIGNLSVLKSTDRGVTWDTLTTMHGGRAISFSDESHATMVGGFAMKRSNDGGATWSDQHSRFTSESLYGMDFLDANNGMIVGSNGAFYRTTDGGTSWAPQQGGTTQLTFRVKMLTNSVAVAIGNGGFSVTSDGGTNWTTQAVLNFSSGRGIYFLNDSTGYICGSNGAIRYTTDRGNVWLTQSSGSSSWLWAVNFSENGIGIIVGMNGTILRTTGSGWNPSPPGFSVSLRDVEFLNDTTVIVVGDNGNILRSTDAGLSWGSVTSGTTAHCNDIYIIDENNLYVATSLGVIYSSDGGLSWAPQTAPVFRTLYEIAFPNPDAGIAVGANGIVLKTSDNTSSSLQFNVKNQWNLVSLPMLVADQSKTVLYPTAVSDAFAYFPPPTGYASQSSIQHGVGYWLKFSGDQTLIIAGTPLPTDTITVGAGWNLIGSVSNPIPITDITTNPAGIISSQYFGFESFYFSEDTLKPGKAYWVKTTDAGTLILSSTPAQLKTNAWRRQQHR